MSEKKFYVYGKFFETKEEFRKFVLEWPDLPLDLEEFKRQMDMKVHEVEVNNQVRGGKLTNREAYQILRMCTDWASLED